MLTPQAESVSSLTHPALESSQNSTHASAQSSIPTVKVSFQTNGLRDGRKEQGENGDRSA